MHRVYENAELSVFASSCENMPDILLESMAAGLPIASSNRGPIPEILGDGGTYFDPENPEEIAEAIRGLLRDPDLRTRCARSAFERARTHTWGDCARSTFAFVRSVAEPAATETN